MALCGHLVWTSILGEEVQTVGRTGHETLLKERNTFQVNP